LRVTFSRGSHILGAASVNIAWMQEGSFKNITFSGDVGCNSEKKSYLPLLKENHDVYPHTDYLVIESTYGDRVRDEQYKDEEKRINCLVDIIGEVVLKKKGKLIIPVFSLDRSQSIKFDMYKAFLKLETSKYKEYLIEGIINDSCKEHYYENAISCMTFSPLIAEIDKIYAEELSKEKINKNEKKSFVYLKDSAVATFKENGLDIERFFSNGFITVDGHRCRHWAEPISKKGKKKKKEYCYRENIFMASSGMGDFGPVKKIILKYIEDENATVLLTGYAPPYTLSGQLKNKEKEITVDKKPYKVGINVEDMSAYYSAHADQEQLLDFVFTTMKKNREGTVFINHGPTDNAKNEFKKEIIKRSKENNEKDRDIKAVHIANEDWFNLNTGQFDKNYNHPCFENLESMIRTLIKDVAFIKNFLIENKQL
jgi:metallo-beta-lactamase family protein